MANISFVLVLLLSLALPFRTVSDESSWGNVLNQAQQAGLSPEDIEKAKKAMDNGEASTPSLWADFVKLKGSVGGSSANAPEVEPLLEADIDSSPTEAPNEAPRASAPRAASPLGHAPRASAPEAAAPKAQAQAPSGKAPRASAPQAEAATPKAQAPKAPTPQAN
ncbi:hypothetical protein L6164_024763 [Bauhinia variegata]|uniref:Uncharacterized protein n=1 Tax=Bauhinia variegata TaxID=167791 RepID=A0ACB9LYS8_BAUVA|nr:hypothetical protein L6164_024763 [Bauhinia variegata]